MLMSTFIKVIEIWTPTADRTKLQLADGVFGKNTRFEASSRQKLFGYDEGLPGKAWSRAFPQIITDLENSYFQRQQQAAEANLSSAIAFPIFSGEFLLAVVVFLCGDKTYDAGAIELWSCNLEKPDVLSLVDGYYGSLRVLEHISRLRTFKKGEGLPGTVWDYNLPIIIDDPINSSIFLRRGSAENDGISMAFGLPYNYQHNELVLTFLSTLETPIARRFEIWVPDRNHSYLFFHEGKCEFGNDLTTEYEHIKVQRGEGMLGKVWLSGCPQISKNVAVDLLGKENDMSQFDSAIAIPLIDNSLLRSLVVLFF